MIGIIAILVGVFVVATGRGGELAYEHADHAPLDLGSVTATDVALLRPPTALWGYNMQVTDEALDRIARALRDRDIEIAFLQRQLTDLGHGQPQAGERASGQDAWYADTTRQDVVSGPLVSGPLVSGPEDPAEPPAEAAAESAAEPAPEHDAHDITGTEESAAPSDDGEDTAEEQGS